MKLSIIIVSWNVKDYLCKCLESLESNNIRCDHEIIVVDNCSSDGTCDLVRDRFGAVRLVCNDQNLGFAAANNIGIDLSSGEYIFLLNPDTVIVDDAVDRLIEFMDHNQDVGVSGPRLLNADGTIQDSVRKFPTFRAAMYRHTICKMLLIFRNAQRNYMMADFDYKNQIDVDQIMGAAFMTRQSVIDKIGGLDERFFMYYEEVDFCYRVKQAGWRNVFTPEAEIIHFGGQSAGQVPVANRMMLIASMLMFFRKQRGRFLTALFCIAFKPLVLFRDIYNLLFEFFRFLFSLLLFNSKRRKKSFSNLSKSCEWLFKYSLRFLFNW